MTTKIHKLLLSTGIVMSIALFTMTYAVAEGTEDVKLQQISDAVPASITKYEYMSIDGNDLTQKIQNNEPIKFNFEGTTYTLKMSETPIRSPDSKAYLTSNGERVEVPKEKFTVYKGTISGDVDGKARLFVTEYGVSGIFKTPEKQFYLDTLKRYDQSFDKTDHIMYNRADVEFEMDLGNDFVIPQDRQPPTQTASNLRIQNSILPAADAQTLLTFDVITDCDKEFYDINSSSWQSRSALAIADMESTMEDAIDITFDIVDQDCVTDTSDLTSTDPDVLLPDLADRWDGIGTSRDGVQLISGKDLDGSVVGIAYKGGMSSNSWSYSIVTEMPTSVQQGILGAHEVGHNGYGEHDDADNTWDWGCFCYKHTIMYDTIDSNSFEQYSSTNYNAIRTEAESNL